MGEKWRDLFAAARKLTENQDPNKLLAINKAERWLEEGGVKDPGNSIPRSENPLGPPIAIDHQPLNK